MLSTAMFDAAQAKILEPLFTSWRMSSTTAVVFPVPGGPCNNMTLFEPKAFATAAFCSDNHTTVCLLKLEIMLNSIQVHLFSALLPHGHQRLVHLHNMLTQWRLVMIDTPASSPGMFSCS